MMQHKYPFTALHFSIDGKLLDINVHPTKMELRFADNQGMYQLVQDTVKQGLSHRELIPVVSVKEEKKTEVPQMKRPVSVPEPFEKKRREQFGEERVAYKTEWNSGQAIPVPKSLEEFIKKGKTDEAAAGTPDEPEQVMKPYLTEKKPGTLARVSAQQLNLFEDKLLSKEHIREHRLIGQLFDTYWLVEFHEKLYIIDQHAAHEKVLYERTMKVWKTKNLLPSSFLRP